GRARQGRCPPRRGPLPRAARRVHACRTGSNHRNIARRNSARRSLTMNPILPRTLPRTIAIALSVGLLAACAGTPQRPPELVRLQAQLDQLHADPAVVQFAPTELRDADNAVAFLLAEGDRMRAPLFDHNIYLAQRLVGIAEATGHGTAAEARIASLSGERERLVLQARASETAAARAA